MNKRTKKKEYEFRQKSKRMERQEDMKGERKKDPKEINERKKCRTLTKYGG